MHKWIIYYTATYVFQCCLKGLWSRHNFYIYYKTQMWATFVLNFIYYVLYNIVSWDIGQENTENNHLYKYQIVIHYQLQTIIVILGFVQFLVLQENRFCSEILIINKLILKLTGIQTDYRSVLNEKLSSLQ